MSSTNPKLRQISLKAILLATLLWLTFSALCFSYLHVELADFNSKIASVKESERQLTSDSTFASHEKFKSHLKEARSLEEYSDMLTTWGLYQVNNLIIEGGYSALHRRFIMVWLLMTGMPMVLGSLILANKVIRKPSVCVKK